MKVNISFLSLALLTLPSLMFSVGQEWRAHTPLLTGAAVGAGLALGGAYIPEMVTGPYLNAAPEVQAGLLIVGAGVAAEFNRKVLDGELRSHTSLRDWAAVGGTAVAAYVVVTQVAARFANK